MAPPSTGVIMPTSSPHSSDEANHDTPSTNPTSFSPETAHKIRTTQPKFGLGITVAGPVKSNKYVVGSNNDDVFLAPTPSATSSQLSPTAEAFTPSLYPRGPATMSTTSFASQLSAGSAQTLTGGVPIGRGQGYTHGYPSAVSYLMAASAPEVATFPYHHVQGPIGEPFKDTHRAAVGDQHMVDIFHGLHLGSQKPSVPMFAEIEIAEGTFTTDEPIQRAFMVAGVAPETPFVALAQSFNAQTFPTLKGINATELHARGVFVLSFSDIRDAKMALEVASFIRPEWRRIPMTPKFLAANTTAMDAADVSDYEGQLLVTVFFDGRTPNLEAGPVLGVLRQTLATFGHIKAIHSVPYDQGHVREFRVEYFDTRATENALKSLNRSAIGTQEFVLATEPYTPDVADIASRGGRPREQLSLTGRSTLPIEEHDRLMMNLHMDDPYLHGRGRQDRIDINGSHNQVVIGRIQAGLDVRTTIMLRNIPNKIDQAMLKSILDETSHGCYDFMYLRIDFANNCNVGYAFINFTDALAIIPFALARAGQRWNRFNSDKIAEISYATIQGKDCLVQKFRNSSVMLEHPTFRPKLYTTGSGPDAGKEEKFPGPDNPSKMRRSVENAEHVGLFAPRQGQAYREEQRRRRSQFDRGTPGAEYEAFAHRLRDPALSPVYSYPQHPTLKQQLPANNYYGNYHHGPSFPWYARGW